MLNAFKVAGWWVDSRSGELTRGDQRKKLSPKATAVLVHLAERRGQVVSKEELLEAVWPGVMVTDHAVWRTICELRRVLGSRFQAEKLLETLPRRGYRLMARVEVVRAVSRKQPISAESGPKIGSSPIPLPPSGPRDSAGLDESAESVWPILLLSTVLLGSFWLAREWEPPSRDH